MPYTKEFSREKMYPLEFAAAIAGWKCTKSWHRNAQKGKVMKPVKIGGRWVVPGHYLATLIGLPA